MPTSQEWRAERRQVRDRLHRLPAEMQHVLLGVRRDDLRGRLVDNILDHAKRLLNERDLVRPDKTVLQQTGDRVLAVDERRVLREMMTPEFLAWLRREVGRVLRSAHLERINPAHIGGLPERLPSAHPRDVWTPAADLDLKVASYADGPPEGWWAMAAQVAAWISRGRHEQALNPDMRVLVLDPGAGGLARAVGGVHAAGMITVQEYGGELTPTDLPWVEGDRRTLVDHSYDLVVWSVPSPSVGGASNHGRIYRDAGAMPGIGALGPRRWRRYVRAYLAQVIPLVLAPRGTAVVRLPLGYRVHQRGQRGYLAHPDLLDGLFDNIEPLKVVSTLHETDEGLVLQPFVGSSRCRWKTVFLRMEEPS